MRCMNCGYDHGHDFVFCSHCGAPAGVRVEPFALSPEAARLLAILRDQLFFAICLVLTISCSLYFLGGGGIRVIPVLAVIFLWQVYSKAKQGGLDVKNLRYVSNVALAGYVLNYVGAGLILVLGIGAGMMISFLSVDPTVMNDFYMEFAWLGAPFINFVKGIIAMSGPLIIGVFAVVALLVALFNLLMMRPICRFSEEICRLPKGRIIDPRLVKSAKTWLMVSGIITAASALGSLVVGNILSVFAVGCSAAVMILASRLIAKYFVS